MSTNTTNSIVIQWGRNIPGRENVGLETFMSVTQYYQGLVNDKKLGTFQTVLFENGNLNNCTGLMILTGTSEQITDVLNSEKHRENVVKGYYLVENLRVQTGFSGEALPARIQDATKWRKELGL